MSGIDQHVLRSLTDWRWYFDIAKSEMGIKAIDYEAMTTSAREHTSRPPDSRRQDAARRHASIERRLRHISSGSLSIIRATCEEQAKTAWEPFYQGGLGNVAHLSLAARKAHALSRSAKPVVAWLDRLGAKLKTGRASAQDRTLREWISRDIEGVIAEVHDEYEKARLRAG